MRLQVGGSPHVSGDPPLESSIYSALASNNQVSKTILWAQKARYTIPLHAAGEGCACNLLEAPFLRGGVLYNLTKNWRLKGVNAQLNPMNDPMALSSYLTKNIGNTTSIG